MNKQDDTFGFRLAVVIFVLAIPLIAAVGVYLANSMVDPLSGSMANETQRATH